MSEQFEINAEQRDRVGKGAARAIRRLGKIPAVIYGDKKPALPITVDYNVILKELHKGQFLSSVYKVNVGGDSVMVIPKDYQLDVVKDLPLHVDFVRLVKGEKVNVEVNVNFINEDVCPGIKKGGVLNVVTHAIELSCDPMNIPEQVDVDLTHVDMGDVVHISDLTIPAGSSVVDEEEFTVASIAAPTEEVVEEVEEVADTDGEDEATEESE